MGRAVKSHCKRACMQGRSGVAEFSAVHHCVFVNVRVQICVCVCAFSYFYINGSIIFMAFCIVEISEPDIQDSPKFRPVIFLNS